MNSRALGSWTKSTSNDQCMIQWRTSWHSWELTEPLSGPQCPLMAEGGCASRLVDSVCVLQGGDWLVTSCNWSRIDPMTLTLKQNVTLLPTAKPATLKLTLFKILDRNHRNLLSSVSPSLQILSLNRLYPFRVLSRTTNPYVLPDNNLPKPSQKRPAAELRSCRVATDE